MVRKFTPDDAQAFYQMARQFHSSDAVIHQTPDQNFRDTFREIMNDSPSLEGYIIEKDGVIAGYSLVLLTYSNEVGGLLANWDEIFIKPEFRGQGLGSGFLALMEKEYQGKAKLYRMEVEKENDRAIALYKRMGYRMLDYRQATKASRDTVPDPAPTPHIRPFSPGDQEDFFHLAQQFHASGLIDTPAPPSHFRDTFQTVISHGPHQDGFMICKDGKNVGYALVGFFYANEAGGMQSNLDEMFILPPYRGQGLGKEFLRFFERHYHDRVIVYRIEVCDSHTRLIDSLSRRGSDLLEYWQMIKSPESAR